MDQVTVTENISYFSRIKWWFKNIVWWIICIFIWIGLLQWNEWRAVQTQKSLEEWQKITITIPWDIVMPSNEWKLVHFTWTTNTTNSAKDQDFGIMPSWAVVIERKVETYQREEESTTTTKDKIGWWQEQTTTYSYKKTWSESDIDSTNFKQQEGHLNISSKPTSSKFIWQDIKVGAFTLPSYLINWINAKDKIQDLSWVITSWLTSVYPTIKSIWDHLYIGKWNESQPEIWDKKISFYVAYPQITSIIAKQEWNSVNDYQTQAWDSISMMSEWNLSSQEMYQQAIESNKIMTWMMRWLWTLLIIIGFAMLFSLLATLWAVIPILGNIIWFWTWMISFILWCAVSIIIIAIAWIRFRPVVWIWLIALVVVVMVRLWKKKQVKQGM
jgi:Transmembrane protein 43